MFPKILLLLDARERRRGVMILVMATMMAALEVLGVVSVMPFLSVLGNPEIVKSNDVLSSAYAYLDFPSVDSFLLVLGVFSFMFILVSAGFRMLTHYAMNRFIESRRHAIGTRLLETYLRQPYAFFLNRHSSDMAKSILSETDLVTNNTLRPAMDLVAYTVVLLSMIILVMLVDPKVAFIVIAILGGVYALIYLGVRGVLGRIGRNRLKANKERFTAAGEALGGIKSIKLLGRESVYRQLFRRPSARFARYQATSQTLSQVPNFLVEAVALGGIIALTLALLGTRGGAADGQLGEILPLLGVYAFAGLRMKPAAQKIYSAFAKLRFGASALDSICEDLVQRSALAEIRAPVGEPLRPQKTIALQDVHYTYPNAKGQALTGINMEIPVSTSIGLVGSTGAGKTTMVDVLLGLLRPSQGHISVDGIPVTDDKLRAWQHALGYVPQDIFLTDSTVSENIALGVPRDQIDRDQVERCARMAQVHDFIVNEMPDGYDTMVGERGVRLSGGQRQRIGIARALYHDPQVLIFDEATSALDNLTEQAVMQAVRNLSHQKTIILIAHRLSTVRDCDCIYMLEKGRVAGSGSYAELSASNKQFQDMEKAVR